MRKTMAVAVLVAALATTGTARAAPVVYDLTGNLTGTLTDAVGTTTFTDSPFNWLVIGNTGQATTSIIGGFPILEVPALADTIGIGGLTLVPTIQTYFALAHVPAGPSSFGIAGFSDVTTNNNGIAWKAAALFGYDGLTTFGPIAVTFDIAAPLPTDAGSLVISGASGLSFSAEVDEPPGRAADTFGAECAAGEKITAGGSS